MKLTPPVLISIGEASLRLRVSIDTLRRWDDSGKLRATRKTPGGRRFYEEKALIFFLNDQYKLAQDWAAGVDSVELPGEYYCQDSSIFQARLIKLQTTLMRANPDNPILSLIVAITGEIGNNSFDHNIGKWPDLPGIFFSYDMDKGSIVLADRGLGVFQTLKKVKPDLSSDEEALNVAFTQVISGRPGEDRGNGLKFVKDVIAKNPISLKFHSGSGELTIEKESPELGIVKSEQNLQGCMALITF